MRERGGRERGEREREEGEREEGERGKERERVGREGGEGERGKEREIKISITTEITVSDRQRNKQTTLRGRSIIILYMSCCNHYGTCKKQ